MAEDLPDRDVKVPDYLTEGDEQGSNEENSDLEEGIEEPVYPVSYTHLRLPTTSRV